MDTRTYFEHYRMARRYDGAPAELGESGAAKFYKAIDQRSGAPVVLTLLPVASVAPEAREQFEEHARASLKLDHINIARTVAFGVEGDNFAFVSESPQGETLESWVQEHGPMSADAVLRVALQVVSALSAGSFYGLSHRAIQPSSLMIVPGQTAEGGWPLVKLMNFGLAGAKSGPVGGQPSLGSDFASPEELEHGVCDFRSEIYSLGATLCFLLTGAFYSAEPRSLQTKRFARPLRNLIAPMLRQNPAERPQDPVLVAHHLRKTLAGIEQRQKWSSRFGIPFATVAPARKKKVLPPPARLPVALPPPDESPFAALRAGPEPIVAMAPSGEPGRWYAHRGLAFAVILIALLTLVAFLVPAPARLLAWHKSKEESSIGVPVGVSQSAAMATAQDPASVPPNALSASGTAQAVPAQSARPSQAMAERPASTKIDRSTQAMAERPAVVSLLPEDKSQAPEASGSASVAPSSTETSVANANTDEKSSAASSAPGESDQTDTSANARIAASRPVAEPPPPAKGPQTVWDRASGRQRKLNVQRAQAESSESDDNQSSPDLAQQEEASPPDVARRAPENSGPANPPRTSRRYGSNTRAPRAAPVNPTRSSPRHQHSYRARFVGMTQDGRLILRLPSGKTVVVAPNQRRARRVIERRYYAPPPPYIPGYEPGY